MDRVLLEVVAEGDADFEASGAMEGAVVGATDTTGLGEVV
jgi:hypothetical protein